MACKAWSAIYFVQKIGFAQVSHVGASQILDVVALLAYELHANIVGISHGIDERSVVASEWHLKPFSHILALTTGVEVQWGDGVFVAIDENIARRISRS